MESGEGHRLQGPPTCHMTTYNRGRQFPKYSKKATYWRKVAHFRMGWQWSRQIILQNNALLVPSRCLDRILLIELHFQKFVFFLKMNPG